MSVVVNQGLRGITSMVKKYIGITMIKGPTMDNGSDLIVKRISLKQVGVTHLPISAATCSNTNH